MRERIRAVFDELWAEQTAGQNAGQSAGRGGAAGPPALADDTVLLETGLDSLGFAILVARLDEELGFDPFTAAEDAFYPQTFGELVAFYEKHAGSAVAAAGARGGSGAAGAAGA